MTRSHEARLLDAAYSLLTRLRATDQAQADAVARWLASYLDAVGRAA